MTDDAAGHILHNILNPPAEPGPPYTHTFAPHEPDPAEALAWLREQITWWLDYARTNAARRPITSMRSHEMRNLIADCEAKLTILDLWQEASRSRWDLPEGVAEGRDPDERMRDDAVADTLDEVVSLLAAGYRHCEGYDRYWGIPPTYTLTEGE